MIMRFIKKEYESCTKKNDLPTFPRETKKSSSSIKSKRDFFNREIYG